MNTTRFNPTVSNPFHLGNLYMILVNEHEAHKTGGKFVFRFEDNQQYDHDILGSAGVIACREGMVRDLDWLGVAVDEYQSQLVLQAEADQEIKRLNHGPLGVDEGFTRNGKEISYIYPEFLFPASLFYPHAPVFTARRVVMDHQAGVNLLIRGDDLLTEFSLYSYFCHLWRLPFLRHVYLPRLRTDAGRGKVSKTLGNHRISDYRDQGYTPKQVMAILKKACLRDPKGGWEIKNVKEFPSL